MKNRASKEKENLKLLENAEFKINFNKKPVELINGFFILFFKLNSNPGKLYLLAIIPVFSNIIDCSENLFCDFLNIFA